MKNARFINSVLKSAKDSKTQMPWTRGKRRAAFIARRQTSSEVRRSA